MTWLTPCLKHSSSTSIFQNPKYAQIGATLALYFCPCAPPVWPASVTQFGEGGFLRCHVGVAGDSLLLSATSWRQHLHCHLVLSWHNRSCARKGASVKGIASGIGSHTGRTDNNKNIHHTCNASSWATQAQHVKIMQSFHESLWECVIHLSIVFHLLENSYKTILCRS